MFRRRLKAAGLAAVVATVSVTAAVPAAAQDDDIDPVVDVICTLDTWTDLSPALTTTEQDVTFENGGAKSDYCEDYTWADAAIVSSTGTTTGGFTQSTCLDGDSHLTTVVTWEMSDGTQRTSTIELTGTGGLAAATMNGTVTEGELAGDTVLLELDNDLPLQDMLAACAAGVTRIEGSGLITFTQPVA